MRDLVVERAQYLKREKKRFIADNPEVCELCGARYPTQKGLRNHRAEKHGVDALGSLFAPPRRRK